MLELWALENEIYDGGVCSICGVDEAGRGPLAGPVCAAAVVLPRGAIIEGLNDSKKLSEKRREALFDEICDKALEYSIAFASCLLYTSPSPRDRTRSRMPSSA